MANTRLVAYADRLFERSDSTSYRRWVEGLMALPLVILGGGLLLLWSQRIALAQPMSHLLFLLGAWMIAILGGTIFVLTAIKRIEYSLPALLATLLALPLAIYFIPLSNFLALFLPRQLGLGAAAGVFGILVSELILFAIRGISARQAPRAESL